MEKEGAMPKESGSPVLGLKASRLIMGQAGEGNTRTLNEKHIAGEVMFEFVDMMSSPKLAPINFGARPFEYIKDANSKVLIKV
ncbi:hypothetical protein Gotur_028490, partial [Gossypium turneri]